MTEWDIPDDPEDATFSLVIEVNPSVSGVPQYQVQTLPMIEFEVSQHECMELLTARGAAPSPRFGTYVVLADRNRVYVLSAPEGTTRTERQFIADALRENLQECRGQLVAIAQRLDPDTIREVAIAAVRSVVEVRRLEDPLHDDLEIPGPKHIRIVAGCSAEDFTTFGLMMISPGVGTPVTRLKPGAYSIHDVSVLACPRTPRGPVDVLVALMPSDRLLARVVHAALVTRIQEAIPRVYSEVLMSMAVATELKILRYERLLDELKRAGAIDQQVFALAAEHRETTDREQAEVVKEARALARLKEQFEVSRKGMALGQDDPEDPELDLDPDGATTVPEA